MSIGARSHEPLGGLLSPRLAQYRIASAALSREAGSESYLQLRWWTLRGPPGTRTPNLRIKSLVWVCR